MPTGMHRQPALPPVLHVASLEALEEALGAQAGAADNEHVSEEEVHRSACSVRGSPSCTSP